MFEEIEKYFPLLVLFSLAVLMAVAVGIDNSSLLSTELMRSFMGFFLCLLAMLKLFNISGFADGYQKYDILAKRSRAYAYTYPFIELALGISYLANFNHLLTNIATLVVMIIGTIGVVKSLRAGLDLRCACLGTVLNVPLSTVTLVEDIGMGLMAFANVVALLGG